MKTAMLRITLTVGMILLGTAMIATTARAEPTDKTNGMLGELAKRLDLTDQQKTDIQPILKNAAEKRRAALADAGIERGKRPGFLQMMKLRGPMKEIRENTDRELSAVLSDTQMTEYRKFRDEMRKKMREQAEQRRKG